MSATDPIDWFWLALRWRESLKLQWKYTYFGPRALAACEQDMFGARVVGDPSWEPQAVWAEAARLAELDARERESGPLVDLAVEMAEAA